MSNWYEPKNLQEAKILCEYAASSGFFKGISGPQALTLAAMGGELGIGVMNSLRSFHIMKGKPTMTAATIAAIAQAHPDCELFELVESDEKKAHYKAKRKGGSAVHRIYTIEDAKRAGLLSNPTWKKYPRAMLEARCKSALALYLFADKLGGIAVEDDAPSGGNIDAPGGSAAVQVSEEPPHQNDESVREDKLQHFHFQCAGALVKLGIVPDAASGVLRISEKLSEEKLELNEENIKQACRLLKKESEQ